MYTSDKKGWALITGATSGIGAAFATRLASKGYSLLLSGRRKETLEQKASHIHERFNVNAETHIGDLADTSTVNALIERARTLDNLRWIICNAGYGAENDFFDDNYEEQAIMIKVHIDATARICHSLAQSLTRPQKHNDGGIIIVSSLASFFSSPSSVFYCSTKAFLNSFAHSLAISLYAQRVPVQALCPGFTHTDFHEKLGIPGGALKNRGLVRWMSADSVASISLRNLRMGKVILIPGIMNKVLRFLGSIIPFHMYMTVAARKGKLFLSRDTRNT